MTNPKIFRGPRHPALRDWHRCAELLFVSPDPDRPGHYMDYEGITEMRAIRASGKVRRELRLFDSSDLDTFILQHDRGDGGVFYGICTRIIGARTGGIRDLCICPALWADIDTMKLGVPKQVAIDALMGSTIPPTFIVDTGGGLHAYWVLTMPINLHQTESGQPSGVDIVALLKQLARICHGDRAVCDLARIMRIPGTHNRKPAVMAANSGKPYLTAIIQWKPEFKYDFSDLKAAAEQIGKPLFDLPDGTPPGAGGGAERSSVNDNIQIARDNALNSFDPSGRAVHQVGSSMPINVEHRLAAMAYMGGGDAGIHQTQLQVTAAMVRRGESVQSIVSKVLDATRRAAGSHGAEWNWNKEEEAIREMIGSAQRKFMHADGPIHDADQRKDTGVNDNTKTDAASEEEQLNAAAALSLVEFDRQKRSIAKALGVTLATLVAEVKKRREPEAKKLAGKAITLTPPEPWHEPVNGAQLFHDLVAELRRYLALSGPDDATLVILWCFHTYLFDAFPVTPRLVLHSPEKRCGKSTMLGFLQQTCCKAKMAANVTPAALFRFIQHCKPCLLLDEADTFKLMEHAELRAIINAGHLVTERVLRTVGDDHEVREFDVFSPMAIAAIGSLPDTIEDRAIIIRMRRRKEGETVDSFPHLGSDALHILQRKLARWADDKRQLINPDPVLPPEIRDRMADNFKPILAIADAIGGNVPEIARTAASNYASRAVDGDDDSLGPKLLADIRDILLEDANGMTSADLASKLKELPDRPWGDYSGTGFTANKLARLLNPYGVKPKPLWNARNRRGYCAADFEDAFARYLTPHEPLKR